MHRFSRWKINDLFCFRNGLLPKQLNLKLIKCKRKSLLDFFKISVISEKCKVFKARKYPQNQVNFMRLNKPEKMKISIIVFCIVILVQTFFGVSELQFSLDTQRDLIPISGDVPLQCVSWNELLHHYCHSRDVIGGWCTRSTHLLFFQALLAKPDPGPEPQPGPVRQQGGWVSFTQINQSNIPT